MDDFFKSKKGIIIIYIIGVLLLIYLSEYKKLNATILFTLFSITIPFFEKAMTEDYRTRLSKDLEDYKNVINEKMENQKKELNKELEEYKTKLSGCTLVTKMQFELEFKIYTEIYSDLLDAMYALNAILVSKDNRERMRERGEYFSEKQKNAGKFANYAPFLSKEIYSVVWDIHNSGYEEYLAIGNAFLLKKDKYDYAGSRKRKKNMIKNMEKLSELIRNRIESMKIIE